jgi:hypothetical protein
LGRAAAVTNTQGVKLQAASRNIELLTPSVDVADIDRGDLDLLATTHGATEWYAQASSTGEHRDAAGPQRPRRPRSVKRHHYGLVADVQGDGLLDVAAGTFWHGNATDTLPIVRRLAAEHGTGQQPTYQLYRRHGAPVLSSSRSATPANRTVYGGGSIAMAIVIVPARSMATLLYRNMRTTSGPCSRG